MDMIQKLQDKNDKNAHEFFLQLETQSSECNELYRYFNDFLKLIHHKSSFVRTRGFCLCCAQIQWDTDNKFEEHIDELLAMLDDDKPTAVRQCLLALHSVVLYRPDLNAAIEAKLKVLNPSKYKDSMRPLIEKDIEELRRKMM